MTTNQPSLEHRIEACAEEILLACNRHSIELAKPSTDGQFTIPSEVSNLLFGRARHLASVRCLDAASSNLRHQEVHPLPNLLKQ